MAASSNAQTLSLPPNQSIYLQNLPEKIKKHDLQRELYMLFSTYGPILDVTAVRTPKMRGQAHVLFRDMHSATQALRACQGMEFFGKEMRITYSKNRSNTLAKLAGTANMPALADRKALEAVKPMGSLLPPPPPSKRPRDESEDEGEEDESAPMEEDDDGEGEMDMSDDD